MKIKLLEITDRFIEFNFAILTTVPKMSKSTPVKLKDLIPGFGSPRTSQDIKNYSILMKKTIQMHMVVNCSQYQY